MAQDTKELIARTAYDMFVERGFRATTLRAIAESCSITHANVVYHFKSKLDLAASLINRYVLAVDAVTAQLARNQGMGPGIERYLLYWVLHHSFMAENPDFAAFYIEFGNVNRVEESDERFDFGTGHALLIRNTLGTPGVELAPDFDLNMRLLVEADIRLVEKLSNNTMSVRDAGSYYLRTSMTLLLGKTPSREEVEMALDSVLATGVTDLCPQVTAQML